LSAAPVALGERIDLGRAGTARDHTVYGTWLAEGEGCWIAGRQARMALALREPASTSLVLELSADGFLAGGCERQRLNVTVNGVEVAALEIDAHRNLDREQILLPRELVAGCDRLDVVLDALDATSLLDLGLEDDDRRIGVFLREMTVRAPRSYELGETLLLGAGGVDEGVLAGGWGRAEPTGRWTIGRRARLVVQLDGQAWPVELEFDATPFLGRAGRVLRVDVLVNGVPARTIACDRASDESIVMRVPIPEASVDAAREMVLEWQIRDPRSPHSLEVSDDRRALGLFIRRLALLGRSIERT
jgi:hypothetical protein